jgi:hypothetical protein
MRICFHLCRTVDNGAVFNVIVLIGSLIGSVIVAFTMIMQTLEQFCGISTDEPSAPVTGDQFASAASIESTLAGNTNNGSGGNSASKSEKVSSKHVAFDDGGDDGAVMGARPFHGNVIFQPSECAIEMQQHVSKTKAGDSAVAALSSHQSQNQSATDHDSQQQLLSMLADMQRTMNEQATRTEAQFAFLTAQMARTEMQVAALAEDHAAHKADLEHKHQLYDQKHQQSEQSLFQLEQWIRESTSRATAAPE